MKSIPRWLVPAFLFAATVFTIVGCGETAVSTGMGKPTDKQAEKEKRK